MQGKSLAYDVATSTHPIPPTTHSSPQPSAAPIVVDNSSMAIKKVKLPNFDGYPLVGWAVSGGYGGGCGLSGFGPLVRAYLISSFKHLSHLLQLQPSMSKSNSLNYQHPNLLMDKPTPLQSRRSLPPLNLLLNSHPFTPALEALVTTPIKNSWP